jgi:hypothetical protein
MAGIDGVNMSYWLILVLLVNGTFYANKVAEFSSMEDCIYAMQGAQMAAKGPHQGAICIYNAEISVELSDDEKGKRLSKLGSMD